MGESNFDDFDVFDKNQKSSVINQEKKEVLQELEKENN